MYWLNRHNDRIYCLLRQLQIQIQALQAQLAQRPPLEKIQALAKEYTNLELILQGTQRENERCMAELERCVCIKFFVLAIVACEHPGIV